MSNNDQNVRRLLPQSSNSSLNSFSYAPPTYQPPRETQKSAIPESALYATLTGYSDLSNLQIMSS
ncbi:hypothetical protein F4776DRAFT_622455 [Hypoxylon sp. NC0597]|nr:hypothetical protein F4776DRAFT_622455 [Hypoxylon sp. NC0597]